MSIDHSITITIFDINGEYREDVDVDNKKNFVLLDSPMRILDQYINDNFLQDLKKITDEQFLIQYKFSYEIQKNVLISINCDIINNFSVSHQRTLESNGYVVFCNLESDKTLELLDKIIDYIRDNCSINIKTYIIGVFKENINEDKTCYKMQDIFSNLDLDFDYHEMYIGDKENFKKISKTYPNAEIMEQVFENVFKGIYEQGKPQLSNKIKDKAPAKDKSVVKCIIL